MNQKEPSRASETFTARRPPQVPSTSPTGRAAPPRAPAAKTPEAVTMGGGPGFQVKGPAPAKAAKPAPTHQQIALRARAIWQAKGCKPGQDKENWMEAEAQLKREMGIS